MYKRVIRYAGRQSLRSLSLLLAVCVVSFMLIVSSPIDPVEAYLGPDKMSLKHSVRALWSIGGWIKHR